MNRVLRSSSLVVDEVVVGGLDLCSRQTCTFLTFGKEPTTPPPRSVVRPASTVVRHHHTTRPAPAPPPAVMMTSATDVGSIGNGRERKSSTETGPADPAAVRPGSEARQSSPDDDDDDDVFSAADVGCNSLTFCRSVSVPPRRTRSCAQPEVLPLSSNAATATTVVSPPRMKRRKKKSVPESESESRKTDTSMTISGRNNSVLPVAARCSNTKVTIVGKPLPKNESKNNHYDFRCTVSDSLPTEKPPGFCSQENGSATSGKAETTRKKKNIRWKSDLAQSSPDVASDDADSKESGYITWKTYRRSSDCRLGAATSVRLIRMCFCPAETKSERPTLIRT